MNDLKHIKRFNESDENSNMSDVSESNDKKESEYYDVRYILELVRDKTITLDEGVERIIEYYSR